MILCDSRLMQVIIWIKGQVEVAERAMHSFNRVSFSYITDGREGSYLLYTLKLYILSVSLFTVLYSFLENH